MNRAYSKVFSVFFAVALFFSLVAAQEAHGAPPEDVSIGELFSGEELQYDIGFWIFHGIAEGRLVLKNAGNGRFVATLSARSNGILDSLLKHRRDRYIATMRLSGDGRRFLTESFEKEVTMDGKGTRRSVHKVDYAARTVSMRSWGGEAPEKTSLNKIPDGVYTDDPLAAFYNFRYGVYGKIAEGKDYTIATFPRDNRTPEIYVRIAPEKELKRKRPKGMDASVLAYARVDKDLFGSSSGDIEILFTKDLLPVQAIAKDLIMFGDVLGKLREVVPAGNGNKALASPPISSSAAAAVSSSNP